MIDNHIPKKTPAPFPAPLPHGLALAIAAAVIAASALASAAGIEMAPYPFIWRDVAAIYLLAALPLAASLAALCVSAKRNRLPFALIVLEILSLLIIPRLYVDARCKSDATRLAALVEQSRFGEANLLLHRVLALNPHATWKGRPLQSASADLDRAVREISARIAIPLYDTATSDAYVLRARDLALLGRTIDAIAVLESSPILKDDPAAANLRATIHETGGEWGESLAWYHRAKQDWQSSPPSPEQTAGLIQALTGVAYSNRKLGRLQQAEAAYQELLSVAPTADSHFLLAQFYDDTQVTIKAAHHARQAMSLNPARFDRPGHQLLDRLSTAHFGCLIAR